MTMILVSKSFISFSPVKAKGGGMGCFIMPSSISFIIMP